jgi:hypothetical protein
MFYNFDINRWIAILIPGIMRKKFLYSIIKAMLYPVALIYRAFDTYRKGIEERLSYNAITIYLEKFLNDLLRTDGIYIVDRIIEQTLHLSYISEKDVEDYMTMKSERNNSVYLSNSDRLVGGFLIMVPLHVATTDNLESIRRWVNYYKYAGVQYTIKIY